MLAIGRSGRAMGEDSSREEEDEGGSTRTRIFVGGLGESVAADDLRKTFSARSWGTVESVDIIRTKGRSFAYVDFVALSDNALSKLFSTYNGCMWKGGRLKLEKAKDHYLLRLGWEWAEDAELAKQASTDGIGAAKNVGSFEKPRKCNTEKVQLHLFFPRSRKLKSLPFNGTGKHKYSFQRIEVPPLPTHFCDCEEHSTPHTIKEQFEDLETQNGGMIEEELKMMESVMNKLFERESVGVPAKSVDNLLVNENEPDYMVDEDNLIMNMVAGTSARLALLGSQEHETMSTKESVYVEPQASKDWPTQTMTKSQKRKEVTSNRKRKFPPADENAYYVFTIPEKTDNLWTHLSEAEMPLLEDQNKEPESGVQQLNSKRSLLQKPTKRDLIGDSGKFPFLVLPKTPSRATKVEQPKPDSLNATYLTENENQNLENQGKAEMHSDQCYELKELAEPQPAKANMGVNKSDRGAAWLQKSSWTQLVGGARDSSFSISQILPGLTFEKQEASDANDVRPVNSTNSKIFIPVKSGGSSFMGECSKGLLAMNENPSMGCDNSSEVPSSRKRNGNDLDVRLGTKKSIETVRENDEVFTSPLGKKHDSTSKQKSAGDSATHEASTFVRSAASMREWAKIKASLNESCKKRGKLN